jgi:predicted permease
MFQDIRFGLRMLAKNPAFTTVAALSLALGIGANTGIFQLLNVVRLKALPVRAPQELVAVRPTNMDGTRGNKSEEYPAITNPLWEQLRDRQQSFSGIFAWSTQPLNLAQGGEIRNADSLWVSGDFFNVLGVQASLGRVLTPADDVRGCSAPGVVISHGFWQREYGGEGNVIGRKLMLAAHQFEIIGVTPQSFFGLEVGSNFDVALPLCADAVLSGKNSRLDSGTNWWLMVTGRLKPGVSTSQATAQLQTLSPALFQQTLPPNYPQVSVPKYLDMKLESVPAGSGYSILRENYERPLWLLLSIAALVLLIACANLANLLLARASTRERELAVRLAVGASRSRLIRQLLVESLLLALVGAALGALLAQGLSRFLVSFLSTTGNPVFLDLTPDWSVLGFTSGVAALTCLLFGLTPALRATRVEPGASMNATGRGLTASRERFSLRRGLVVVQVALSLVLVAGAVLFSRSLNKLQTVDTGFEQEGLLITRANFSRLNVPVDRRQVFKQDVLERLKAIPGVAAAAETRVVPLSGGSWGNVVWPAGTDGQQRLDSDFTAVGADYFKMMRAPLLQGREFDSHDSVDSTRVAIINETLARKLFNGANPLGKKFWVEATPSTPERDYEIVGLAKNSKYEDLREDAEPIVFLATSQDAAPANGVQFLIRSTLRQAELTAAVTRVLAEISPDIQVSFRGFKTMIEESLVRDRLMATLSGLLGGLALLLASIGLYGILSYGVASRTKEIGIRMALGAQAGEVRRLVLREALILVLIGVVVGVPVIFAATRFASSLLFDLTPTDPLSLSLAALLLFAVAMVAGYLPARRATKVDPLVALRYE